MASKKRKQTTRVTVGKTHSRISALSDINSKLMQRVLGLEYLLENMLGNDLAKCSLEHAERMVVALVRMEGHPLGTDQKMRLLVSEFVARALKYENERRPSSTSGTMQ
jgi:hypothetical protein